jgi:hypothetical protein
MIRKPNVLGGLKLSTWILIMSSKPILGNMLWLELTIHGERACLSFRKIALSNSLPFC